MKTLELYFEKVWTILQISTLLVCLLVFLAISFHFNGRYIQKEEPPESSAMISNIDSRNQPAASSPLTEQQQKGKELFEGNCTACHAIDKVKVGPALTGISQRRPIKWIRSFVRNSQKVIRSGDPYAVKLYNDYNQTEMTAFPSFTDEEIDAIVAYLIVEKRS